MSARSLNILVDQSVIDRHHRAWTGLTRDNSVAAKMSLDETLGVSVLWRRSYDARTMHCPRQLTTAAITPLCPRMWILNYNSDDSMKGQPPRSSPSLPVSSWALIFPPRGKFSWLNIHESYFILRFFYSPIISSGYFIWLYSLVQWKFRFILLFEFLINIKYFHWKFYSIISCYLLVLNFWHVKLENFLIKLKCRFLLTIENN